MTYDSQTARPARGRITLGCARAAVDRRHRVFSLRPAVIFTANSAITIMNQMAITIVFALSLQHAAGRRAGC